MNEVFHLKIMSPVAVVFEADVVAVSAENSEGVFDILPDHARFMSLLATTPVQIELPDAQRREFVFENALLFFEDNHATIYVQELLSKITP